MSVTRKYMKDTIECLKDHENQTQEAINELKSKTRQIEKNAETAAKQVTGFANELINAIENSKNELLQNINRLRQVLLEKVNKERTIHELRIKEIQTTRDFVNKLLKRVDCNKQIVDDKVSHVLEAKRNRVYLDPTIRFDHSEDTLRLKLLGTIGSVNIIEEADCSKCYVEDFHSKFEAFSVVKLCIRTNTFKGKPCIVLKHMVQAEVQPAKHISNLDIVEGPVGIVEVRFLPRVSGKLSLNVKINGEEVQNGHLSILVQPRTLKVKSKISLKEAGLQSPCGLAMSPDFSKIAVSDVDAHCIAIFTSSGDYLKKIGKAGAREGRLSYPDGLAFLNDHELAVADRDNHRVQIFDINTGQYMRSVGKKSRVKKTFKSPWGVAVDAQHQIIVSDTYNRRVQIFDAHGAKLVKEYSFGDTILPSRTLSYNEYLIVADALDNNLHIIDQKEGPLMTIETKGSSRDSLIESLNGVALDRDANIAVCDGDSVKLFSLDGNFIGKTNSSMSPSDLMSLPDGSLLVIDGITGSLLNIK